NVQNRSNKIFRCLYRRCPPLPIPNREVKPARADGTAVTGGRVGRRPILQKPCLESQDRVFCVITVFDEDGHLTFYNKLLINYLLYLLDVAFMGENLLCNKSN